MTAVMERMVHLELQESRDHSDHTDHLGHLETPALLYANFSSPKLLRGDPFICRDLRDPLG